jgi:hypothetical protein
VNVTIEPASGQNQPPNNTTRANSVRRGPPGNMEPRPGPKCIAGGGGGGGCNQRLPATRSRRRAARFLHS